MSAPDVRSGSRYQEVGLLLACSAWAIWQVWIALTVPPTPLITRTVHLGFALAVLAIGWVGESARRRPLRTYLFGVPIVAIGFAALFHAATTFVHPDYARVLEPLPIDHVLGWTLIFLVLAAAKYTTGMPLLLTATLSLAYVALGQYIPAPWGHQGFSLTRILSFFYMQPEGLFGPILGTSATLVYPVVLFGALMLRLGGDDFFRDAAIRVLHGVRGAAPKMAVMMSALFSTITGAGPTNVAASGVVTIPAMKKAGYPAAMAGGIEAAASIGGQLAPPIMGAAAFLMADLLVVPYSDIIGHAIIPAVLFFFGTFLIVHFMSLKLALPDSQGASSPVSHGVASGLELLKGGWHFLAAIGFFILLVAWFQLSVGRSAVYSLALLIAGAVIVSTYAKGPGGLRLSQLRDGVVFAGKQAAAIALAIAAVELIVSSIGMTGLGLKLSSILTNLAGDRFLLLLVLTAIASIILGTGLPTTPTYLVLAVLVAPALADFGMPLIAAHLFVFYFGVWGDLSPPTAVGPTVASGIAESKLLPTMGYAMSIGSMGLIVPFIFALRPELLGFGTGMEVLGATIVACAIIIGAASAVSGYLFAQLPVSRRILLGAGAVTAIEGSWQFTAIGLSVIAGVIVLLYLQRPKVLNVESAHFHEQ